MPATAAPGRFIGHAIAASAVLCSVASSQSITTILPPPGGERAIVHGISGDGSAIFGISTFPYVSSGGTPYSATIWGRQSGEVSNPGASWYRNTTFAGSNYSGTTLVGSDGIDALRWNSAAGFETLTRLAGGKRSSATGVSSDGAVTVGESDSMLGTRAVRWTLGGGVESIGTLAGGNFSSAQGVSANGTTVIGYSDSAFGGRAFRWDAASGMQSLGVVGNRDYSTAVSVNSEGSVIVGHSGNYSGDPSALDIRAFRWTDAGGMQDLGVLSGSRYSYASATDASGAVVTGWCEGISSVTAFLWHRNFGMVSLSAHLSSQGLDTTGWAFETIRGISADGRYVAGYGRFEGEYRAFIADIGVIPAPGVALMFGFVGLSRSRRRA
jgi:probable HAF family extracellular repeat protein